MSGWNYRVLEHTLVDGAKLYQVHEVYYDGDTPSSWTEDPVPLYGETLEDLMHDLLFQTAAFNKPVLAVVDGELVER